MPSLETFLAMSGFAAAASATLGPVNIIGAMTGARYGMGQALIFVTGATSSFSSFSSPSVQAWWAAWIGS